ncbi:MAG: T9SS type A sorting domain-containing protein [Bacteroidia bacterium]
MKRTLSVFLLFPLLGWSQSGPENGFLFNDIIVFEHFTNASCGPCAAHNPTMEAVMSANTDKATSIKYHTSWPGTDPMYSFNTVDPTARVGYYQVNGVPSVRISNQPNLSPAGFNQQTINSLYPVVGPAFNYTVLTEIVNDTLKVSGSVMRFRPINAQDLTLHVAVVEDPVDYSTPPGSNGEKNFPNVVRKLLPDPQGTHLGNGAALTNFNFSYRLAPEIIQNHIYVVVFVQASESKIAYRGAKIKAGASLFPTSNPELQNSSEIRIYPNPTTDYAYLMLQLTKDGMFSYRIYDTAGRTVKSPSAQSLEAGEHQIALELTGLPKGLYQVYVQHEEAIFTRKILLK